MFLAALGITVETGVLHAQAPKALGDTVAWRRWLEDEADRVLRDRGPAEVSIGVSYAWGETSLSNVKEMLIRQDLFPSDPPNKIPSYTIRDGGARATRRVGMTFGLRPYKVPLYWQLGLECEWMSDHNGEDYDSRENSTLSYEDTVGLKYWVWCNYTNLILSQQLSVPIVGLKLPLQWKKKPWVIWRDAGKEDRYPEWEDQNRQSPQLQRSMVLGLAARASISIPLPYGELEYRSDPAHSDLGPDPQIQQNLNNTLKPRSTYYLMFGFEIRSRYMSLQYFPWTLNGGSDAIRTQANPYLMQEVRNEKLTEGLWSVNVHLPLKRLRLHGNGS